MKAITSQDVKKLRDETGVGMMDAKRALTEAHGDVQKAIQILRTQGQKLLAKKQARSATEGWVGTYTHPNGTIASMVQVSCETDFVARSDAFQEFVHQLAMHVAAANPTYLTPTDVPADVVAHERSIAHEAATREGKPAPVIERIVAGKLEKFYAEQCLLKQAFVMDDARTIEALVAEHVQKLGEKIEITRFARFAL
ncbi:MAG: translation elongation factor Ts [Candidatus Kerfeldbacteria bacterium]|nr:translation elongation factor Ts [Candidatus Kerfeldbacteria bacterium]